jgi:hypothetical protein
MMREGLAKRAEGEAAKAKDAVSGFFAAAPSSGGQLNSFSGEDILAAPESAVAKKARETRATNIMSGHLPPPPPREVGATVHSPVPPVVGRESGGTAPSGQTAQESSIEELDSAVEQERLELQKVIQATQRAQIVAIEEEALHRTSNPSVRVINFEELD